MKGIVASMARHIVDPSNDIRRITFGLTQSRRRQLLSAPLGAVLAGAFLPSRARAGEQCTTVSDDATVGRPLPQTHAEVVSLVELELAFRNHGFMDELLREPITPLGCHYLLNHFDIPHLDADGYTIQVGGRVSRPFQISLSELQASQTVTQLVTMECAGVGRATLSPRPLYVPWLRNDFGTYQWTGTPLAPLLTQAGLLGDAVEVLFTGWDVGVDQGVEHAFERSIPVADAMRPEVMLVWAANGQPLLPQHGFPLRLIVPSWYGVASVKWLRAITVLQQPFEGMEEAQEYRYRQSPHEEGEPVREKRVMSVILPPGIPDMLSRERFVRPGTVTVQGMAWSGGGSIAKVEFSADGGQSWQQASLTPVSNDPYAWVQWEASWTAGSGTTVLMSRATDTAGASQPLNPNDVWNLGGDGVNAADRVTVSVKSGIGSSGAQVPSVPKRVLPGAELPPPTE
jgi:sulfane dehydrogenase subunit SoxC